MVFTFIGGCGTTVAMNASLVVLKVTLSSVSLRLFPERSWKSLLSTFCGGGDDFVNDVAV